MRARGGTLIGLALVAGAFVALIAISLTSAVVYYVTPSELTGHPTTARVRLYGIVQAGSVHWNAETADLSFKVGDGTTNVSVVAQSLPTGLFRDGVGVVLAGSLTSSGTFVADEVLVKHSEVYAPLQPGETPPANLLESLQREAP